MSVIVNDQGFQPDDLTTVFVAFGEAANDVEALDVPSDARPHTLVNHIDCTSIIRIDFPSSADGRGFTIARQLRRMGFTGRLRARGHVISDQYAMARRCGFDEIEISDELAARQPEAEWLFRTDWQQNDYQSRLRG
jgi:uncharacterized protein (DUF934 family)